MFAIFSLRRPDILPVGTFRALLFPPSTDLPSGDLGVQRGVLRWILSRHVPSYSITISPKKLPRPQTEEPEDNTQGTDKSVTLPLPGSAPAANEAAASVIPPAPVIPVTPVTKPVAAAKPKAKGKGRKKAKADSSDEETDSDDGAGVLPTPFTPSINKILTEPAVTSKKLPTLPDGLTVAKLKSRLDSKNKVKWVPSAHRSSYVPQLRLL